MEEDQNACWWVRVAVRLEVVGFRQQCPRAFSSTGKPRQKGEASRAKKGYLLMDGNDMMEYMSNQVQGTNLFRSFHPVVGVGVRSHHSTPFHPGAGASIVILYPGARGGMQSGKEKKKDASAVCSAVCISIFWVGCLSQTVDRCRRDGPVLRPSRIGSPSIRVCQVFGLCMGE